MDTLKSADPVSDTLIKKRRPTYAQTRKELHCVTGWVTPAKAKLLRIAVAERETTIQHAVAAGIDLWLRTEPVP